MKGEDDRVLVSRCHGGDRAACGELVARYQKPIFNAALRMLHQPEDARDVAQTTFLKAFEHLGDYNPSFKFYSWIYRIALNESLNALGARRPLAPRDADDEADEALGPEQRLEGEQMSRAIDEALSGIKPELRTLIVLRHFMHLSYQDIADIVALPEKTVKSRLYTARQMLRDSLLQQGTL